MADLTSEELMALPEWLDFEYCVSPSGHTEVIRKAARFLVNRGDILFYTLGDDRWQVLEDSDGTRYRKRFPW